MDKIENKDLLSIIDTVVKKTMTMDLTWEWPCGVAYYGICRAFELTKNQEYLAFLEDWTKRYIELGLPAWNVNTCAMGHTMLTLYKQTGEELYHDIIKSKVKYLRADALRFGDNVLQHTVSSGNDFPEQCWAKQGKRALVSRIQPYGKKPYVRYPLGAGKCVGGVHDGTGKKTVVRLVSLPSVYGGGMLVKGSVGGTEIFAVEKRVVADNS